MAGKNQAREALTVILLCIIWYAISSSSNVVGKLVLNNFPYPMTLTMVQLLSIVVLSGPSFNFWGVRKHVDISKKYYLKLIVPLALGKFLITVFSDVSILKVPVSYAHTVKATLPLFTVILSRIFVGEKQSLSVYLSLVPIISGVAVATATEISFNIIGLTSALLSTAIISLQHIYSKKVMRETGIHHLRLLQVLGKLAFTMFLPIWMFTDCWILITDSSMQNNFWATSPMIILNGVLGWLQNVVAFSVLSLVSPLTYAVASAAKRLAVIAASLVLLRNPVTSVNVLGMFLAILGVLAYNKAKYDQRQVESKPILPVHSNGYNPLPQNGDIKSPKQSIFIS